MSRTATYPQPTHQHISNLYHGVQRVLQVSEFAFAFSDVALCSSSRRQCFRLALCRLHQASSPTSAFTFGSFVVPCFPRLSATQAKLAHACNCHSRCAHTSFYGILDHPTVCTLSNTAVLSAIVTDFATYFFAWRVFCFFCVVFYDYLIVRCV